jgi:hypothetical protein
MWVDCNFITLVHLVLVQIIQNVIDVAEHQDVDKTLSFTIFNINQVNILLKQSEESRMQTTCNFNTLVPVVVTLCRLIHVAERDDFEENVLSHVLESVLVTRGTQSSKDQQRGLEGGRCRDPGSLGTCARHAHFGTSSWSVP